MKKKFISYVAVLISILTVFMSYPFIAIAYVDSYSSVDLDNGATSFDLSNIEILCEEVSKRGQSEKHFKLSDGSFIAVQYNEPVHYLGESGKWLDIDNTLYFDEAVDSSDFDGYVNTANSFETKFANTTEEALFYISDGDNKLSFTFVNDSPNSVEAVVIENATVMARGELSVLERNEEIIACDDATAEISYGEVMDDVDFSYTVTGGGVKENIIINSKLDDYDFTFAIEAGSLELTLNESGSIIAKDSDGNTVYTIPAPFMYDADGHYSDSVHYELSGGECGQYFLTISADEAWINGSDISFPVTVDPIVSTADNECMVTDVTVNSVNPTNSLYGNTTSTVGKHGPNVISRTYLAFESFPTVQSGNVIVSAKLNYMYLSAQNGGCCVELYGVTEAWDPTTITWNSQPNYSTQILDYNDFRDEQYSTFVSWDITNYVQNWYEHGTGFGLLLMSTDENIIGSVNLLSHKVAPVIQPQIIIRYVSQQGIEDDYTYVEYEDFKGGTAYVNNYSGTLTYLRELYASPATVMPMSIGVVYNSAVYKYFHTSEEGSVNTCLYTNTKLGMGWKLSVQESIIPINTLDFNLHDSNYAYIYNDKDGTDHYFYVDESSEDLVYIDEKGLGMTLTYSAEKNKYILKTQQDIVKEFNVVEEVIDGMVYKNGYIEREVDKNCNTILYSYAQDDPTQLISINDPTNTIAVFAYCNNFLSSVTIDARTISFAYNTDDDGKYTTLKSINDSYGIAVEFTYDESDVLTAIANADGSGIEITYISTNYCENAYKVSSVGYHSGPGGGVRSALYTYDTGSSTTLQYIGDDCIKDTEDDIFVTYIFDENGNTSLIYTEDYQREIVYSTSMYGYTNGNSMSVTDADFKLSDYASTGVIGENYVKDSNCEGATLSLSATNSVVEKTETESYIGKKSFKCTSITEGTFSASFEQDLLSYNYTFSAYVKTDTNFSGSLGLKVIDEDCENNDYIGASSEISSTIEELNGGWYRLYADFYVKHAQPITLKVEAVGTGSFYVDAFQIEINKGFSPSAYNMLENPGFEAGFDGWEYPEATTNVNLTIPYANNEKFGLRALVVEGDPSYNYEILQSIDINNLPDKSFVLSGWAKGQSVLTGIENRAFDLVAKVHYEYIDSTNTVSEEVLVTSIPFVWKTNEWQYVSGVVDMPVNDENKTVTEIVEIEVGVRYNYNANTVYFDSLALVQDSSVRINYDEEYNMSNVVVDNSVSYGYEYDANGNVTKILDENGNQISAYEYDENGNLLKEFDSDNLLIKQYVYDAYSNLIEIKDGDGNIIESYTYLGEKLISMLKDGVTYDYTYNAFGMANSQSVTREIDGVMKTMYKGFATNEKSLITGVSDSLGNVIKYGYSSDLLFKYLESIYEYKIALDYDGYLVTKKYVNKSGPYDGEDISWNGTDYGVMFTYDDYHRLVSIELGAIKGKPTHYVLTYNSANLLSSISIQGEATPLITYLYNDAMTKNIGVQYSDETSLSYEYDILGNVCTVLENDVIVKEYKYNSDLLTLCEKDQKSNSITDYYYSDDGALYLTRKSCEGYILQMYAIPNNSTETNDYIVEIDGSRINYLSTTYENSRLSKHILYGLGEIEFTKDEFDRAKEIILTDSQGDELLRCTYGYVETTIDGELRTSEYISNVSYSGVLDKSYTYIYEADGNIYSVSDGEYETTYSYHEESNLLTRENNEKSGKTWIYEYDETVFGRISQISEYAYTKGIISEEPVNVIKFEYTNNNRKDMLTKYNNLPITYNAQGNPLNWTNDRTFTWSGTQLQRITEATGDYVQYEYNADGVRTKAIWTYTDGSQDVCEYIVSGTTLLGEMFTDYMGNTYDIFYFYDTNGSPLYCEYNGEIYYYVKNVQGDITALVSENGTVVVTYDYDAWGKIINTTTLSSAYADLAYHNSLRYHGYIYDFDTDLYYVESRYYDPEVTRFINAKDVFSLDATGDIVDYNLYVFADGNPVNYKTNNTIEDAKLEIMQPQRLVNGSRSFITDTVVLYDVPVYNQGDSYLCWANCWVSTYYYSLGMQKSNIEAYEDISYMLERFELADKLPKEQGKEPNLDSDIEDYSLQNLYDSLVENGPLYLLYRESDVPAPIGEEGHVVLLIGVDMERELIYTYNPWGIVAAQRYEDFFISHTDQYGYTDTSKNVYIDGIYTVNYSANSIFDEKDSEEQ